MKTIRHDAARAVLTAFAVISAASKQKPSDLFACRWLRGPATTCRSTASPASRRPSLFATADADDAVSVLLAWIVGRVDVLDAAWSDEMNLDDGSFLARPTIVRMLGRVHPE